MIFICYALEECIQTELSHMLIYHLYEFLFICCKYLLFYKTEREGGVLINNIDIKIRHRYSQRQCNSCYVPPPQIAVKKLIFPKGTGI